MDNPGEIFSAANLCLKSNGSIIVEVPCGDELLNNCYFDTIYHEHVNYFNKYSLALLGLAWGYKLEKIKLVDYMGGSLRAVFRKDEKARIEDIVDGKRRRMNADEATVFAIEIIEDIITH